MLIVLLGSLAAACSASPARSGAAPTAGPAALPPPGSQTQVAGGTYVNITPAQLRAMLKHKDFWLVNTHAPYGVEIEQTDAHIPLDEGGMLAWAEVGLPLKRN